MVAGSVCDLNGLEPGVGVSVGVAVGAGVVVPSAGVTVALGAGVPAPDLAARGIWSTLPDAMTYGSVMKPSLWGPVSEIPVPSGVSQQLPAMVGPPTMFLPRRLATFQELAGLLPLTKSTFFLLLKRLLKKVLPAEP